MIVKYFSIYDKKSELFGQLFPSPSIGSAERMLQEQVNRDAPDNLIHRYPADFALYLHFEVDDHSGVLVNYLASPPQLIVEASSLADS